MKLLIADDDVFFRRLLVKILSPDHEIIEATDGVEAWAALQKPDAPRLAIFDWVMPTINGPQLCRRVRQSPTLSSMYLILLTGKNSGADVVAGLRAGADDYVTKPFVPEELLARVKVGETILGLKAALAAQLAAANEALASEKRLQDILLSAPYMPPASVLWPRLGAGLSSLAESGGTPSECELCRVPEEHSVIELAISSRKLTLA